MIYRKMLFLVFAFLFFLFSVLNVEFVSAGLCSGASGYYSECGSGSSGNHYSNAPYYSNNYNTFDYAPKPVFKGSYGNYRYEMYAYHGDTVPNPYFQSYGYGSYGYPVFSGGYYGYDSYYGYSGFGSWFWY